MSEQEFPKHFDHANCESKIWKLWEHNQIFDAEVDAARPAFCVVIPPPNVTGILHMGHILDNIPQDVMTRWHRMRGFSALWIPGTDHAGIATQNVVKKNLDKEGIDYRTLGREGFIERVWEWKKKSGGIIIEQLKRLGCSCDWRRERFTMDDQLSRAVTEAFIRYYNKGLVYRGKRMINWCTVCETALANDEVEHEERSGHLWHLKYPLMENGKPSTTEFLIVATTRPETMLGDTAVAIHPNDPRHKHLHGKSAWLPLQNREIPIILDDFVDLEFGSGAVKITPAHDVNDYQVGKRHKLDSIQVIGLDGKMTAEAGEFAGLDRFKARARVVEKLEALELLAQIDAHKNSVGQCYRCNSVVEPLESDQWFVKMKPLAEKARAAVEDGRIQIIPESEKNDYFHWMDTIEDWCISRQLWWGHRIPVYYCKCGEMVAAASQPEKCKCGKAEFTQDNDVLDTWFSSQLWPYSTLGWPDHTLELKYWYPNSWLMSGRDILFFWDARMIMSGLELAGDVPFRRLVLHGLVRDAQGRKLSKSLNNSPDPLKLFDEHGTDAIRAAIALRYPMGRQDSKLTDELYRNGSALITKLWNSFRFVVMNLGGKPFAFDSEKLEVSTLEDRWILSRLNATITAHDKLLAEDSLTHAFQTTTGFFWNEFCDWYIEIVKPRFAAADTASREAALATTLHVLRSLLKVFHPYIPFITEELWQQLAAHGVTDDGEKPARVVALAQWPQAQTARDDRSADGLMHTMMTLVRGVRDARSTLSIAPKSRLNLRLSFFAAEHQADFAQYQPIVQSLAFINNFEMLAAGENPKNHVPFNFEGGVAYLELPAEVKGAEVKTKLNAQIAGLEKELDGISKRMENKAYVSNAPAAVVEESRARQAELNNAIEKLRGFLEKL